MLRSPLGNVVFPQHFLKIDSTSADAWRAFWLQPKTCCQQHEGDIIHFFILVFITHVHACWAPLSQVWIMAAIHLLDAWGLIEFSIKMALTPCGICHLLRHQVGSFFPQCVHEHSRGKLTGKRGLKPKPENKITQHHNKIQSLMNSRYISQVKQHIRALTSKLVLKLHQRATNFMKNYSTSVKILIIH